MSWGLEMRRKESLSWASSKLRAAFWFVVAAQFAGAQPSIEPRREIPSLAAFSAGTDLVLVPVAVIDRKGASITGLTRDNFTVWDDKTPQPIVSFHSQDAPCSVGIVLDTSGSMKELLRAAKDVVGAFLKASNPADEFFLLTVSSRPQIQTGITDDPKLLQAAVRSTVAGGNTALFDTVYLALDHLRKTSNHQRALLVISDGIDNHSRYTAAELMSAAAESDAQIYTIAINERPVNKKPVELADQQRGSLFMSRLAERTGGLNFSIADASQAQQAAAEAGVALRNQYVVGFKPAEDASGKLHSIKVRVNLRDVIIRSRNGYRAP
jgi:Ca-activated chloride channel family protein